MENDRYIQQKKEYNSKLSTFQISKELHKKIVINRDINTKYILPE